MTRCRFHFGFEMHLTVVPRIGDIMSLLNMRHCSTDESGVTTEWFSDVRGKVTQVIWTNGLPGFEPMANIALDASES